MRLGLGWMSIAEQGKSTFHSSFHGDMSLFYTYSVKGLRATIAELEGGKTTDINGDNEEEEEEEEWVDEVVEEEGMEKVEEEEENTELLLAKFDDIEAEIESVLELVQSEEEEEEEEKDVEGKAVGGESVTFHQTRITLPQESVEMVTREQLPTSSWRVSQEPASPPLETSLRREQNRSVQLLRMRTESRSLARARPKNRKEKSFWRASHQCFCRS